MDLLAPGITSGEIRSETEPLTREPFVVEVCGAGICGTEACGAGAGVPAAGLAEAGGSCSVAVEGQSWCDRTTRTATTTITGSTAPMRTTVRRVERADSPDLPVCWAGLYGTATSLSTLPVMRTGRPGLRSICTSLRMHRRA